MKVTYYWSEDSIPEICEYEEIVTEQPCRCYHCDSEIPTGTACARLQASDGDIYILHETCAEKGLQFY